MTKHSDAATPPDIVVVDGSNIATEGRSTPSLAQLHDAVTAFLEENLATVVTVVVDATFGHRIAKKEAKEFDEAVANNELVAPPAGAIGRGDAFVLSIANKVGARILSNDSFQEFHGQYPWLFDEGRLIGGKPVPNIGWVFVPRVPVQGSRSRRAQRDAKSPASATRRTTSAEASQPLPVPTKPPPGKSTPSTKRSPAAKSAPASAATPRLAAAAPAPVNDTLPFLEFVEKHPVGTSVNAEVESYSSHGAYASVGDVRAYIPLALIADPPPRSARSVISIGEALTLVVASYSPSRRSIDLAFPNMMAPDGAATIDTGTGETRATTGRRRKAQQPAEKKPAATRRAQATAKKAPAATKKAPATAKKAATTAKKSATARKTATTARKTAATAKKAPATARKTAATTKPAATTKAAATTKSAATAKKQAATTRRKASAAAKRSGEGAR
jgi:hypothetical protein